MNYEMKPKVHGINGPFEYIDYQGQPLLAAKGDFYIHDTIVSGQFLGDMAEYYDSKYYQPLSMSVKLRDILDASQKADFLPRNTLDLGCGTGNSVAAVQKLFPESKIVATDISPEMIRIVHDRFCSTAQNEAASTIQPLLADATSIAVIPGSFDLIIGSSMLHHLVKPFELVRRLVEGLRPGGAAIFFEPFMAGTHIIRGLFRQMLLLQQTQLAALSKSQEETLTLHLCGIDMTGCEDRRHPLLQTLDDKWIFMKRDFLLAAESAGADLIISPSNGTMTFRQRLQDLLGSSFELDKLPPVYQGLVDAFDDSVGDKLREEYLFEGSILFMKKEKTFGATQ